MDESTIQKRLYLYFQRKGYEYITPNVHLWGIGEADLVAITLSNLIHEVEIKISTADFRREFQQKRKKHQFLELKNQVGPNYFWLALSPAVNFTISEIPDYIGVMQMNKERIQIIRKAPRRHTKVVDGRVYNYLSRGLMLRYWRELGVIV